MKPENKNLKFKEAHRTIEHREIKRFFHSDWHIFDSIKASYCCVSLLHQRNY
jgi:hypothetical protein